MFERTFVINLDRRPERLARFERELPADWPWPRPERVAAIDGRKLATPTWWRTHVAAWGCYRSHLATIERLLNEDVSCALVLEDDAVFAADFTPRAQAYLAALPADWELAYLGGQLLRTSIRRPERVNELVLRPFNVNRLHAYAVRGRDFLLRLYQHLTACNWRHGHHIDHHLGVLHEAQACRVYCPSEWLVGQTDGTSDIKPGAPSLPERYWPNPASAARG